MFIFFFYFFTIHMHAYIIHRRRVRTSVKWLAWLDCMNEWHHHSFKILSQDCIRCNVNIILSLYMNIRSYEDADDNTISSLLKSLYAGNEEIS